MLQDDLLDLLDTVMKPLGSLPDAGEEFRKPALDVVRYYVRPVRMGWIPIIDRGLSVVAAIHQPPDLASTLDGFRRCLDRVARAANGRYPPWRIRNGLALGLTALIITPEPIRPDEEATLAEALSRPPLGRAVPLGVFRLNLGQETMAFSLKEGPDGLFNEPRQVADALCEHFRRYVPLMPIE